MNSLRNHISKLLLNIPIDFGGGCSASKAYVIAYLIRKFKMENTLDIGVYRGRSLFPQAFAHKNYTDGMVYGVDPWSKAEAKEDDNYELKEKIDKFISEIDFEEIYQGVENLRQTLGLENNCLLVRKTSSNAAKYFKENNISFNLIHIDGNHDRELVNKDVELYTELLRPNGFIVMDDVSWDSVKPAYNQLSIKMPLIFQLIDAENDYAIFWNTRSHVKLNWLRVILKYIGKY